MFGNDSNWIVAGVAGAATIAGLSLLLAVPLIVSVPIGALVFGGLVYLLTPRQPFEAMDESVTGTNRGQLAYAKDLLADALPFRNQLGEAADNIAAGEVQVRIRHLLEITDEVFRRIEASPALAPSVRRFLTFYLPRASEVARAYFVLEQRHEPDTRRLDEVNAVVIKLEDAFAHYSDGLVDAELETLDVDLKLIEASLKEDLGR